VTIKLDRKLIEESCKKVLTDIITDNKLLREKLSFKEHVALCDRVSKLSYNEAVSYISNNGELLDEIGIRAFEKKFRVALKYGLAAAAGGIISAPSFVLAPVAMFTYFLFRKLTDPCWKECKANIPFGLKKKLCQDECYVRAAEKIVKNIRSQRSRCRVTLKPLKCEKGLNKEYIKWSKKLQVYLVRLQKTQAKITAKRGA